MKKTTRKLSLGGETVKILDHELLHAVAGGYTNTCLGTACQCFPTYGPDCPTVGYTNCKCSQAVSNCGCQGTAIGC